ncbi:MAG: repressor LexA [bacterium TMED198]|nr:MAG: repressor LexA [bacterium TMED198]
MNLSPKKRKFVEFIKGYTNSNGYPPTFVEIMKGMNIKSLGTINWYVNTLEGEGVIKRLKGFNGKRSISILESKIKNTLPLLGIIKAGYPLEAIEDRQDIEVPSIYQGNDMYVLRVSGDSMQEDGIIDGDHVVVRSQDTAQSRQNVVAYLNGEATLKTYIKSKNSIELHPRNSLYSIINVLPSDDFSIGGVVVGLFRSYK